MNSLLRSIIPKLMGLISKPEGNAVWKMRKYVESLEIIVDPKCSLRTFLLSYFFWDTDVFRALWLTLRSRRRLADEVAP